MTVSLQNSPIRLDIYLSDPTNPGLVRTQFVHPLLNKPLISDRGKYQLHGDSTHTFGWTSSLQALVLFLVKSVAHSLAPNLSRVQRHFTFSGEQHSPAAALDYALTKQPDWLFAIFGCDSTGKSLARRAIQRCNSERKRPGPVSMALNPAFLAVESIHIYIEEREERNAQSLLACAQVIFDRWKFKKSAPGSAKQPQEHRTSSCDAILPLPSPFSNQTSLKLLKRMMVDEVMKSLSFTQLFNSSYLREHLRSLERNPWFAKVPGSSLRKWSNGLTALDTTKRLGLCADYTPREVIEALEVPLPVHICAPCVGALALFRFLRDFRKFPLVIHDQYTTAVETLEYMEREHDPENPAAFLLGIGQLPSILNRIPRGDYSIRMPLPPIRFEVVSKKASKNKNGMIQGDLCYLANGHSSSALCFDQLKRAGLVNMRKIHAHHMNPDEVTAVLKSSAQDTNAILWFPHCSINVHYNECVVQQELSRLIGNKDNFLVASQGLQSKQLVVLALEAALRDAWLSLIEQPQLLREIIDSICHDPRFMRNLTRSSGLHHLHPTAVESFASSNASIAL